MHDGYRVLDSDIHLMEPVDFWAEYLDPAFRDRAPKPPASGIGLWEIDGKVIPPHIDDPKRRRAWMIRLQRAQQEGPLSKRSGGRTLRDGTTPQEMLEAMETEGIDVAVVFRTWAQHVVSIDGVEPAFAAALARAFNRWLYDFCRTAPERLKVAALVPLHDTDLAVAEARHAVEQLGAVTLVLPSMMVNGRPLYDPAYEPLWAVAEDLNVAVSLHGIHSGYNQHLSKRYLENLPLGHAAGQTVELILALGAVLTGGVLARHPSLRMAFLEGNCGWLPWWLWALDERWEKWGDRELFRQDLLPSELFRRQCWVSVEPSEPVARHTLAELGDDNFVLSTDWPHDDSPFPHAIESFLKLEGFGDDSKRKVLWDNCARLYNLA